MMRKVSLLIGILLLYTTVAASGQELRIYNWSEYMDPDLMQRFEQRYQVKVHEIYYESDDIRDEMLLETDGQGYDIALVNGAMIATPE